jgi:GR25 family glycosyltransferase involved in LPS biosynthesis
MTNKINYTISIPENFYFNNQSNVCKNTVFFSNDLEPFSYTHEFVSKSIIKNLETFDQTFEGFVKREIITRIQAIFILIFQVTDFIHQTKQISCLSLDRLSASFGIKDLTNEQLKINNHQLRTCIMKASQCVFGIFFGFLLSVIDPACYVPFFYASKDRIVDDPVNPAVQYPFDQFFDKTTIINLINAHEKREVLTKHLQEIGVKKSHLFNAVNGYQLADDAPIQIKNKTFKFKDLYSRMNGAVKQKKARVGCYLSHLSALKKARDEHLESVLIIEDDAIFPQTDRGRDSFKKGMEDLPNNWDILFLGIEHDRKPSRYSKHLDRVLSGTCLHAYAVHRRCYDRLIDDLEEAILNENDPLLPVDEVVSEQIEKNRYQAFSLHTLVGYQRDGLKSHITGHINADYPLLRQILQRVYSYQIAPWLTPCGIPKYKIYKTGLRIAKALNFDIEEFR